MNKVKYQNPNLINYDQVESQYSTNLVKTANYVNFKAHPGEFKVNVYKDIDTNAEHMALIKGNIINKNNVLVRVHSKCLTSEVFHNMKCDCRQQLLEGLSKIFENDGVFIYLDQEGRGIGMGPKLRAYELQDQGLDSAEANLAIGTEVDNREYEVAAQIIKDLRIKSIRLLTNNPDKVNQLVENDILVTERVKHTIQNGGFEGYYTMKSEKLGHVFESTDLEAKD